MCRGVAVPRISRILIRGNVTLSPALRKSLVSTCLVLKSKLRKGKVADGGPWRQPRNQLTGRRCETGGFCVSCRRIITQPRRSLHSK